MSIEELVDKAGHKILADTLMYIYKSEGVLGALVFLEYKLTYINIVVSFTNGPHVKLLVCVFYARQWYWAFWPNID